MATDEAAALGDVLDIFRDLPIDLDFTEFPLSFQALDDLGIGVESPLPVHIPTPERIQADLRTDRANAIAAENAALKAKIAALEKNEEARMAKDKMRKQEHAKSQVDTPTLCKGFPDDSFAFCTIREPIKPGTLTRTQESSELAVAGTTV